MRVFRRLIDILVPLTGMGIVLGAVLFVVQLRVQIVLVIVGILVIEAGIWKVANPLLPNERKFFGLREEGDQFIRLIRRLNRAALDVKAKDTLLNREVLDDLREEMIASVDRMFAVAGRTDQEIRMLSVEAGEASAESALDRARNA
jgi:hypothetical protein